MNIEKINRTCPFTSLIHYGMWQDLHITQVGGVTCFSWYHSWHPNEYSLWMWPSIYITGMESFLFSLRSTTEFIFRFLPQIEIRWKNIWINDLSVNPCKVILCKGLNIIPVKNYSSLPWSILGRFDAINSSLTFVECLLWGEVTSILYSNNGLKTVSTQLSQVCPAR